MAGSIRRVPISKKKSKEKFSFEYLINTVPALESAKAHSDNTTNKRSFILFQLDDTIVSLIANLQFVKQREINVSY